MRALLAVSEQDRNDATRFGCRTGSSTKSVREGDIPRGKSPFRFWNSFPEFLVLFVGQLQPHTSAPILNRVLDGLSSFEIHEVAAALSDLK